MASIIPSVIAGAGSLFSGITGKNSAKKAADIQSQSLDKAMAQQQAQFDQSRSDFMPFLQGGQKALGGVGDLLGLGGPDVQQTVIDQLKASPAFTSLYGTGQDTILQNAAATGGLRGGDTQHSLAQFGSNLLGTVIQNQLSNLGGLVNVGAGAAGNLGALGSNNAQSISNLLTNQGKAQATGVLGAQAIQNNTVNDISKLLQGVKW